MKRGATKLAQYEYSSLFFIKIKVFSRAFKAGFCLLSFNCFPSFLMLNIYFSNVVHFYPNIYILHYLNIEQIKNIYEDY